MIQQSHSQAYIKRKAELENPHVPIWAPWHNSQCLRHGSNQNTIGRWMDKEHVHSEILLRNEKEWKNAICSIMDGPRDNHTKWSKSERESQISYDTTYRWNWKIDTNELIYKRKTGTFLVVQWLRIRASTAGGVGSIPGVGRSNILHASQCSQKNKRERDSQT